jgi:hypothetical protein
MPRLRASGGEEIGCGGHRLLGAAAAVREVPRGKGRVPDLIRAQAETTRQRQRQRWIGTPGDEPDAFLPALGPRRNRGNAEVGRDDSLRTLRRRYPGAVAAQHGDAGVCGETRVEPP